MQCKIIYIHVDRSKRTYIYISNNECAPGLSRQDREICPEDDYSAIKGEEKEKENFNSDLHFIAKPETHVDVRRRNELLAIALELPPGSTF